MKLKNYHFLVVAMLVLCSCSGLHFNQTIFETDKKIENDTQALLLKSGESYAVHKSEVDVLKKDIANAIAVERNRRANRATISMWMEVSDPAKKGSLFNLFDLWEKQDKLSPAMVPEATRQSQRLLSSISDLENHKIK